MTDSDLHTLAIEAGALVLGEDGTRQQYLFDLSQLNALRALLDLPAPDVPPCPIPPPPV